MKIRCTTCGIYFHRDSSEPVYTLCDKCLKALIASGEPVAPAAATGALTFTGEATDGEVIDINGRKYEFDIGGTITPGNVKIDISGDAVAATGTITATQPVVLGKKVTIGTDEYVIDDESGDYKVNVVAGTKVAAAGTLSLTGVITPGSHAETVLTSTGVAPTPITQATKLFTFGGGSSDGETIRLGARTYEFDNNSSIASSNVLVDISAGTKTQAVGTLSISGVVKGAQTFTIGTEVYEFDAGQILTGTNISVDIKSYMVRAAGILTMGGAVPSATETILVGTQTYKWVETLVDAYDVLIEATVEGCIDNLVAAANKAAGEGTKYGTGTVANSSVTTAKTDATHVTFTSIVYGTIGNSIPSTETMADVANIFDATVLGTAVAGSDCTAANAEIAAVAEFNTNTALAITATGGAGESVVFTADAAGALDGSLGNAVASTAVMTNGTFAAAHLVGGTDATAAESATALITAVAADIVAAPELTTVTAQAGGAGEFTAKSLVAGIVGNSIIIGETTANGSFAGGATLLSGGLEADTVVLGSAEYVAVTSLSSPTVPYEVMIGASAAEFLDNLKSAVNQSAGSGTTYSIGTVKNPVAVATTNTDTTQKFIAREPGTSYDAEETSTTAATLSWEDTTFGGGTGLSVPGVDPETADLNGRVYSFVDVLSETNGATAIADQVLFGADSAAALDNLKLAVNHGATEGTNYSTGTVVNADATADANTNTSQVFTAKSAGSIGNAITTVTNIVNGSFASATLVGGTDATAIEFGTALTASIVAISGNIVSAIDGLDGTVALTATTAGVLGNDIATTTDITGASFAETTLIGGLDASAANAVDEAKKAINADALAIVTAVDGTGDVLELTSKVKDVDSNLIRTTTTCVNATFGAATLEGGVTGTPGWEDQVISTASKLYISTSLSTSTDSNWEAITVDI